MKLSEISIDRPVLATVMSLAIVLFGVISWTRLPIREYPDIDPPIVSITTFYRGASPSVVETEITDVLEEQLATIEGVRTITSSSREQGSVITVEFELARNVDAYVRKLDEAAAAAAMATGAGGGSGRGVVMGEIRATMSRLKRPIEEFTTSLASGPFGSAPVTIQLPELEVVRVRTVAAIPVVVR